MACRIFMFTYHALFYIIDHVPYTLCYILSILHITIVMFMLHSGRLLSDLLPNASFEQEAMVSKAKNRASGTRAELSCTGLLLKSMSYVL